MGAKIQSENYLPLRFSMRDLNEDSNSCSWPPYYGDRVFASAQVYCNGFLPRGAADASSGYDKDAVKRTMLEHEAIFKNQVYELHRLYRVQRDMMDEVKMKELPLGSRKRNSLFNLNSCVEDVHSNFSAQNGGGLNLESRPVKCRRKMFDLQLPAEEYICTDDEEQQRDELFSVNSSYVSNGKCRPGVADLNEPIEIEDNDDPARNSSSLQMRRSKAEVLEFSDKASGNSCHIRENGFGRQWHGSMINTGTVVLDRPLEQLSAASNSLKGFSCYRNGEDYSFPVGERYKGMLSDTPCSYPLSSSSLTRTWSNSQTYNLGSFGERWNSNKMMDIPSRNGYSHGSTSNPKETSINFSYNGYDRLHSRVSSRQCSEGIINHSPAKSSRSIMNSLVYAKEEKKINHEVIDVDKEDDGGSLATLPWRSSKQEDRDSEAGDAVKREAREKPKKHLMLDINVPLDDVLMDLEQGNSMDAKTSNFRREIDLNCSVNEDDALLVSSEIDLETPVIPENGGNSNSPSYDENIAMAAEAIVAISSSKEGVVAEDEHLSSLSDSLCWLADIISGKATPSLQAKDLDYFETMTLKLPEIKTEDYMPKPLIPENLNMEAPVTTPSSTRKARRGRQRRDFQRDILPGLASLSRHEVTEDLQIFGGILKATGSSRRNNTRSVSARGRRRMRSTRSTTPLIQQINTIEVSLEDRNLTGWGKTPRRPRRQRCHAGNQSAISLT